MNTPSVRRHHLSGSGFTLVEMLVVVGIIAIVAASSLLLLDKTDDRARDTKTRESYKELRTALFGPDLNTTLSGNVIVSGYLADTGRLPTSIKDLVEKPTDIYDWEPIAGPDGEAMGARINHGWRGPYIDATGGRDIDPWGFAWHYRIFNTPYRPGYSTANPAPSPPAFELGSLGNDGGIGGTETYARDIPETTGATNGLLNKPETFTLTQVAIPTREIAMYVHKKQETVYHVGVLFAGLDVAAENFVAQNVYNRSILRDPRTGFPLTVKLGGVNERTSTQKGKKDKGDVTVTTTTPTNETAKLPTGIYFNLGYARQFQLVLYDAAKTGPTLYNKMAFVDPIVFTYIPNVHSTGGELLTNNAESNKWYIDPKDPQP